MSSGRVLTGFASRNAGGWLLEQSNGRVQVPIDQVKFVADSMVDAYRKQRDSVIEPTPATHLALAQWCISYRLHNEARDELKKCLNLDPDHAAARKLLHRLDEMLDPVARKASSVDRAPARTADGFLVPDVESLGGLSVDAATTFTQRIQPLLVNKCGNASCHGTTTPRESSSGFHLTPVRSSSGAHRLHTERNLAEIMRYVDLQEPSQSQLLSIPQGTHGGAAGIFNGTTGNTQIKMLRAWIKTVAAEKQAEEAEMADRPSLLARKRGATAALGSVAADMNDEQVPVKASRPARAFPGETVETPRPEVPTVAGRGNRSESATAPSRKPVVEAEPPRTLPADDAFDPDIFNQRFHSAPRQ